MSAGLPSGVLNKASLVGTFRYYIHTMLFLIIASLFACNDAKEHTAPAIRECDSVPMMTSYGVNTMISDSGIMRYRIIAERWEVNENVTPPRWIFRRGLFLEQFDEKYHVETFIQADTAHYYTVQKLWHLWGNVRIKTTDGLQFSSEELYWDQDRHELYSNKFSHLITPERELQGTYFSSDERMMHYKVTNTKGSFTREDIQKEDTPPAAGNSANQQAADSMPKRQAAVPRKNR